ncbi:MAG: HD domain-containing protein [Lachnospiraceae bacterium]|nr:HD domain-containing protein [Lachnospiraceae bacterium]
MATTAYGICMVISVLVILWMVSKGYETIDVYYWTMICIIPVVILAYWLKTQVTSPEAAMITFCFIYFDSTVLLMVVIFLMLRVIRVEVPLAVKLAAYSIAFVHLFIVWVSAYSGQYFSSIRLIDSPDGTITKMTGGPLRIFHYIYLAVALSVILGIVAAAFLRRRSFSRRSYYSYLGILVIGLGTYIIEGVVDVRYSLLPYFYTFGEVFISFSYDRIHSHDIACIVSARHWDKRPAKSRKEKGARNLAAELERAGAESRRGYVAFDLKHRFLSCNQAAREYFPALTGQRVDELLSENNDARRIFYSMIDAYEKRGDRTHKYRLTPHTFTCEISPFSISPKGQTIGYFFEIRDITAEQGILDEMRISKAGLKEAVAAKTADIRGIQDKIVGGMANMIENRDNSTGGHVKRTSDIIRILIDEIIRQKALSISEEFAGDIIRAAPMHDLGKLTIENAILNKPAKLTDEEYEVMKTHAVKSGEMVMILLDGVEEGHFVHVAYHVARYHHERWDGRGYPEGLVGSMIPVEARIMAVADVYDTLACKRSYKEAMDPNLVAKIIMEGMGTQFDPAMRPIFIGCREKLEAYYRKENSKV